MWSNSKIMVGLTSMFLRHLMNWMLGFALLSALSTGAAFAAESGTPAVSKPPAINIANLFPDDVVAKGKGLEIKRSQLDDAMLGIKSSAAAQGQSLPPDRLSVLQQQVLERLIQIQLLLTKATDGDKTIG